MVTSLRPPKTILEVWKNLPEGTLCQIINNHLIISPSPVNAHQTVLLKISSLMFIFLQKKKAGEMWIAPFDVHFSKQNIFQPDIFFASIGNTGKIESRGYIGAPDLVIEILSPGTAKIDLGEKKDVYEQYGVKEYVVVNPETKIVRQFVLKGKSFSELPKAIAVIDFVLLKYKIRF